MSITVTGDDPITAPEDERGEGAVVASVSLDMTPGQAAELLALPRRYVEELLDVGAIPSLGVGAGRRIALTDLLVYRRGEDARREAAMTGLVRMSERLGLYSPIFLRRPGTTEPGPFTDIREVAGPPEPPKVAGGAERRGVTQAPDGPLELVGAGG